MARVRPSSKLFLSLEAESEVVAEVEEKVEDKALHMRTGTCEILEFGR